MIVSPIYVITILREQDYGFSKPYSGERARIIDEEVSRIIAEQYERAKKILQEHASGHNQLADVLISREVIFTEDVEKIFGKRPWTSRTEEILAARAANETAQNQDETENSNSEDNEEPKSEVSICIDADNVSISSNSAISTDSENSVEDVDAKEVK